MQNATIFRVLIIGAIAAIGMIVHQTYWVVNSWNLNEEEFNKKVILALKRVATSLADVNGRQLPPRNIVNRRASNYYVVNIDDEINASLLETYLWREFENLSLNIDFEYAVFDCHSNEMVYGNYCKYNPTALVKVEKSNMPIIEGFTYYFGVKFPTRPGHIFGKMWLSIVFSILLLFTIAFFIYAMSIILRQKHLSELQKDFINNMTHEFKTPISTIGISADVLLNHPVLRTDHRLNQYAAIIKEQNNRLNNQVEKVLQLAKVEKNGFLIKKETISLLEMTAAVVENINVNVESIGGHISLKHQGQNFNIFADPFHLSNVLYNLLDNAIKYCRNTPDIQIELKELSKKIEISIKDNGIGIAKENFQKIFEKFYRVPTGNVHNVKGFGLGLFYVKKIVDAHHWQINLSSELGHGTEVILDIPKLVS